MYVVSSGRRENRIKQITRDMKIRFKDKTANCYMKNDISKPLSGVVIMSTISSCMVELVMPTVTVLIKEICVIESMSPIDNEIFNQILYSEVK